MERIRNLRRIAGRTRDRLLYGARDRRLAAAAEAARAGWVRVATENLPPLTAPPSEVGVEVHTMCGEAQATMGIWASWSLLRHLPEARLVVHSDGTLTAETAALWQRVVPGMRLVTLAEGRAATTRHLARFPHLLDWTERYHFGIKLGGYQSLLQAPRPMDMDTDTLTFRDPVALRAAFAAQEPTLAWNRDMIYSYGYSAAVLQEIAGDLTGPIPEFLNAGYMANLRFEDPHLECLEELLQRFAADPRTDPLRYWMHQTLIALLAARPGVPATALPQTYDVHSGPTRPEAVMRHFVGNAGIRPRFFTEGIPQVIRIARAEGVLGADFCRDVVPEGGAA